MLIRSSYAPNEIYYPDEPLQCDLKIRSMEGDVFEVHSVLFGSSLSEVIGVLAERKKIDLEFPSDIVQGFIGFVYGGEEFLLEESLSNRYLLNLYHFAETYQVDDLILFAVEHIINRSKASEFRRDEMEVLSFLASEYGKEHLLLPGECFFR